jgi:hypothetical protein
MTSATGARGSAFVWRHQIRGSTSMAETYPTSDGMGDQAQEEDVEEGSVNASLRFACTLDTPPWRARGHVPA